MQQMTLLEVPARPYRRKGNNPFLFNPKEFKVQAMRDCPTPAEMQFCDTPDKAAAYWRLHVTSHPYFSPDVECFVTLLLNTRRKVKGHVLISTGTLDTILVHPREVFRPAIAATSAATILMHGLCAAAHKLCYVTYRFMCSALLAAARLARILQPKECA
jgi:hypothetical protein